MSKVTYKFNDGTEAVVENVPQHIAQVCKEYNNEYERLKRQQSRYCVCFDILNDKDKEIGVWDEYQKQLNEPDQPDYLLFIESLTERQLQVLKLLYKGKTPLEAAEKLNISKQSVNDIRKAIQNKFLKMFGAASLRGKVKLDNFEV